MKNARGNQPTLRDVAERANVSIQTISRVINNKGEVSEATRQRVLEVVSAAQQHLVLAKTFAEAEDFKARAAGVQVLGVAGHPLDLRIDAAFADHFVALDRARAKLRDRHGFRGRVCHQEQAVLRDERDELAKGLTHLFHRREDVDVIELDEDPEERGTPSVTTHDRLIDELPRPVAAYLDELPEVQREVLVLRHVLDHTVAEIAELVDVPVDTVKSRLLYARRALRKLIRRDNLLMGAKPRQEVGR